MNSITERIVIYPQLYILGINTHFIFALLCTLKKLITRYLPVFRIKTGTKEVLHIIREKRAQMNIECLTVSRYRQTVKCTRHVQQFATDISSRCMFLKHDKSYTWLCHRYVGGMRPELLILKHECNKKQV